LSKMKCVLCGSKAVTELDGKIVDKHRGFWTYGGTVLSVCSDCYDWYMRLNLKGGE